MVPPFVKFRFVSIESPGAVGATTVEERVLRPLPGSLSSSEVEEFETREAFERCAGVDTAAAECASSSSFDLVVW